jgi:hypothetical protein
VARLAGSGAQARRLTGCGGQLMELNGWYSPQMLRRYSASARARRTYDRIMTDRP